MRSCTINEEKKKKKTKTKVKAPKDWEDPWASCFKSIYGGNLSPKEEYEKVSSGVLRDGYVISLEEKDLRALASTLKSERSQKKRGKRRAKSYQLLPAIRKK